jgi:cytochrome c biogenesis protein CcdA
MADAIHESRRNVFPRALRAFFGFAFLAFTGVGAALSFTPIPYPEPAQYLAILVGGSIGIVLELRR